MDPALDVAPARARFFNAAAYDRASNRLVVALGRGDVPTLRSFGDVWVLSNASGNCTAGQPCTFQVTASDPDAGDTLTYALDAAPAGMTIDAGDRGDRAGRRRSRRSAITR